MVLGVTSDDNNDDSGSGPDGGAASAAASDSAPRSADTSRSNWFQSFVQSARALHQRVSYWPIVLFPVALWAVAESLLNLVARRQKQQTAKQHDLAIS